MTSLLKRLGPSLGISDLIELSSQLQDELLSPFGSLTGFAPAMDVYDDSEAVHFRMEIPGVKIEDVKVQIDSNILTISGNRKSEKEEARRNYRRSECHYGEFTRSFELPRNVDSSKIHADMADGVLSVRVMKREPEQAKKLEVKIGKR